MNDIITRISKNTEMTSRIYKCKSNVHTHTHTLTYTNITRNIAFTFKNLKENMTIPESPEEKKVNQQDMRIALTSSFSLDDISKCFKILIVFVCLF